MKCKECVKVRVWKTTAMMALMCGAVSNVVLAQGNAGAQPRPQANQPPATQPAPVPGAGTKVGVIDMGYILDKHPSMLSQIEQIDAQIAAEENAINSKKEQLIKEFDSLKQFNDSTPEYRKKEEEVNKMQSQLTLEFNRKDKEFAEKKAKVVFDAYKQVEEVARGFAQVNQIGVLVRYNRRDAEMDPKKPQSVQMGIMKSVVYFDPSLDLTDAVLDYLKQSIPQATPNAAAPRNATAPNTGAPRR